MCMKATCVVTLTEKYRKIMAVVLSVLHGAMILGGLAAIPFGFCINSMMKEFGSIINDHRSSGYDYFWVATGGLLVLVHGFLMFICSRMILPKTRNTPEKPWLYQMIFTAQLPYAVMLLIFAIALSFHDNNVSKAFQNGLTNAMKAYSQMGVLKMEMDELQIKYKCCGTFRPMEWYSIRWFPESYSNVNGFVSQGRDLPALWKAEMVPFSCCDPGAKSACHHLNIGDDGMDFNVYKIGCADSASGEVGAILGGAITVAFVTVLLQVISTLLFRLMHTSCDTASSWGDPTRTAKGYLCFGGNNKPEEEKEEGNDVEKGGSSKCSSKSSSKRSINS